MNKPIPEWRWRMAERLCGLAEHLVVQACKVYPDPEAHWVVRCHEAEREHEVNADFTYENLIALIKGEK